MAAVSGVFDLPAVDLGELTFLTVDTRTPCTREYPGSERGVGHPLPRQKVR